MAPINIKHTPQHGPRKNGPNKIVATATSVALVSAFGVGAFALGQGGADFDPSAFQSAYNQGQDDQRTGYQASTTDTQAQANRKDDGSSDQDKGAETKRKDDSFSKLPAGQQSGSTSYRVTGDSGSNAQTVTVNGGNSGDAASGTGTGDAPAGPVVSGGDDANGAGTGGSATPGTNPGDGGNNSGGTGDNTGGNTGGADFTPNNPVNPVNKVDFSKDPTVKKPEISNNATPVTGNNPETKGLTSDMLWPSEAEFYQTNDPSLTLYVGQKPTPWEVFCSIDTVYYGARMDTFDFVEFAWTTTEEKFALYDYFKIVDYPEVIPSGEFDIKIKYRFSGDDEWKESTVKYTANESRTYIVSSVLDNNGELKVLGTEPKTFGDTENTHLLGYTESLLKSVGGIDDDGTQSKLVMGWMDENGDAVPFPYKGKINPGRHYYQPSGFADLSSGYIVKPETFWLDNDTYVWDTVTGSVATSLQTLEGIKEEGRSLPGAKGSKTLTVPTGVNAIKFASEQSTVVDVVEIPSTVLAIDMSSDGLLANKKFVVEENNPNYSATSDGVLVGTVRSSDESRTGKGYIAVPLDVTDLNVPSDVIKVDLSSSNKIKSLDLSDCDASSLEVEYDCLKNCNVVVKDDQFEDFVVSHYGELCSGVNTVSMASNPSEKFYVDEGMVHSKDKISWILDTSSREDGGVRDLFVSGPHTFLSGCLSYNGQANTYLRSITFADDEPYVLEDGCFAGGALQKIVCRTKKQYDYVKSRLDAAGAPDAEVVLGEVSKEGHRYYVVDKDGQSRVVLLQAANGLRTFDGTLTASDGTRLELNEIGPRAFGDQKQLKWVQLPESVDVIDDEAFKGCTALEGLFEACEGTVNVGKRVLADLPSMRFVAFRSIDAEFESVDQPNSSCLMYASTAAIGGYTKFFERFPEENNVSDFEVVELSDGTLVLYGTYINGPWLLLATGSTMPSKVELPSSTKEIYQYAFQGIDEPFEVNWEDLDQLMYIDDYAFANSGVSGKVCVGTSPDQSALLKRCAFYGCKNITSFESKATKFDFYDNSLSECSSLKKVKLAIGDLVYTTDIAPGSFYKDNALETIEFTSEFVTSLTLFGSGAGYEFNTDWSGNGIDEADRLRIKVPSGMEKKYLDAWVYQIAGYPSYDDMYKAITRNLLTLNNEYPTEIEVKREMSKRLLVAENRLRTMLGMEKVDVSSYLPFSESEGYGFVTSKGVTELVSAPEDVTVADLGKVELPKGVKSFTVAKSAFSKCSNLKKVIVPDCVSEIESGAFEGHDGLELSITSSNVKLPMDSEKTPFTFGAQVKLDVPADIRRECLEKWPVQSYVTHEDDGEDDAINEFDVMMYAFDLWTFDMSEEEFDQAVNGPFMKQENYFRKLMGMEEITALDDLAYRFDVSDYFMDAARTGKLSASSENAGDKGKADSSSDKDSKNDKAASDKSEPSATGNQESSDADKSTKDDSGEKKDSASDGSTDKKSDSSSKKNDSSEKGASGESGTEASDASKDDSLQNPNAKDAGQSGITE